VAASQVWRSDGAAAGNRLLVFGDFEPTSIAGQLFLGGAGEPLRRLDAAGTNALSVLPGYRLAASGLGEAGGRVLFFAYGEGGGSGLWITDGPGAKTRLLHAGLLPVAAQTGIQGLVSPTFVPVTVAGTPGLLFAAFDDDDVPSLWFSDGTPEGSRALAVDGFPQGGHLAGLGPFAGGVLIAVRSFPHQVWFSDGTVAGTRRLVVTNSDVRPDFTEVGGVACFSSAEGELWRSDGTPQGTFVLVAPDDAGWLAGPSDLVAFQGRLVFAAADSELGRELWVSDGTVGGNRRVGDVAAGPLSSDPAEMTAVGDLLFFSADDAIHGRELWALPGAADVEPGTADDDTLCLGAGGRFGVSVEWHDQHNGTSGVGHAVPVEGSAKSGTFWFFRPENVELLVKVLDGVPVNGFHWVFWGALSDVEYTITVTDTATADVATYHNLPGEICGGADTTAF